MSKREKKPKELPISKRYPGTEAVAKELQWTIENVRLAASIRGCPLVRGGKGRRFKSVADFKAWFDALPDLQKARVPNYDKVLREQLGLEIAKLTWAGDDAGIALARDHTYGELVAMRDKWKDHDETEKGENAAREALGL